MICLGVGLRQGVIKLPKASLFQEARESHEHCHLQPSQAIQETAAEHVELEESQRRPQEHSPKAGSAAAVVHVSGGQAGVMIHLRQVVGIGPTSVMEHSTAERSDAA